MSATSALLLVVVAWVVIGVTAGIVMGRRGRGGYAWAVTGAVLGPLVLPLLARPAARRERPPAPAPAIADANVPSAGLDLVAGVDGSQDATGALMTALALFGPIIRRLTIATVADDDGAPTDIPRGAQETAPAILERDAQRAAGVLHRTPQTVVLHGRPAEALAEYARAGGYDLVVVAPRGRGVSRLVFGSVASEFARGVGVPVAILPPAQLRDADDDATRGPSAAPHLPA